MSIRLVFLAVISTIAGAASAMASDISVTDAYARASSPTAKAGAAFMIVKNSGETEDRLIAVTSEVAARTELHTHLLSDDGVMQMRPVENGLVIPASGQHALQRGGDHVMFMGLVDGFDQGDIVSITLTFEHAGEITIDIPVDLER